MGTTKHVAGSRKHDAGIDILRMLWVKDDTDWGTKAVLQEHRKQIKPFSWDYKQRKIKLLGNVIRAAEEDPMRKVIFEQGTIEDR